MLPTYNLRRKNGVMIPTGLTVVREFAATALLDAGNALGHYATTKSMEMACDRAKEFGVGVVTVASTTMARLASIPRWRRTGA